jgi:hypothetical protein
MGCLRLHKSILQVRFCNSPYHCVQSQCHVHETAILCHLISDTLIGTIASNSDIVFRWVLLTCCARFNFRAFLSQLQRPIFNETYIPICDLFILVMVATPLILLDPYSLRCTIDPKNIVLVIERDMPRTDFSSTT